MKLESKTALVTGGGSGIGLAISKALAYNSVKVIICGRNLSKLEKAKKENPQFEISQCDITDDEQVKNLVGNLKEKFGGIDILINNAGMFGKVDYDQADISFESQRHEIDVDFTSPLRVIHYFLPMLKSKKKRPL